MEEKDRWFTWVQEGVFVVWAGWDLIVELCSRAHFDEWHLYLGQAGGKRQVKWGEGDLDTKKGRIICIIYISSSYIFIYYLLPYLGEEKEERDLISICTNIARYRTALMVAVHLLLNRFSTQKPSAKRTVSLPVFFFPFHSIISARWFRHFLAFPRLALALNPPPLIHSPPPIIRDLWA